MAVQIKLPPVAKDFIQKLLCNVDDRLGSLGGASEVKVCTDSAIRHEESELDNASQMLTLTLICQSLLNVRSLFCQSCLVNLVRSTAHGLPGMQAHPFFAGISWDALAGAPAPYVPTVTHELDTQNFEEFEVKEPASESMSARRRLRADPNFIGYTYKNWEAVSPRDGEPCLSNCSMQLGSLLCQQNRCHWRHQQTSPSPHEGAGCFTGSQTAAEDVSSLCR